MKPNETKREIEKALIDKEKTKEWLAKKLGMTAKLFSAKLNGTKRYTPLNDIELQKISILLPSFKIPKIKTK